MNKIGIKLGIIGILQLILAYVYPSFSIIFLWSGISWCLVSLSHGRLGSKIYGKNISGHIHYLNMAILLPYYLVTWITWRIQIALTKEPVYNEIIPHVWLGRRCINENELPPDVEYIVDLTAEFSEPKSIVNCKEYILLPAPDGGCPDIVEFENTINRILKADKIYIHCALGHGRSATFLAGLLIGKGHAATIDEAGAIIQSKRPAVHISRYQQAFLNRWINQRTKAF